MAQKDTSNGDATIEGIALKRTEGLILVMETPKGRGVFASKDIPGRTVVEVSPVLVLDPKENERYIKNTILFNYTYNWPYIPSPVELHGHDPKSMKPPSTTQAVVLGIGSMFNHSTLRQNVGWERDVTNLLITYIALRDIKAGEELCISYGQRLTFKDTDSEEREPQTDDWTDVLSIIDLID
ncbi:SET domain protein [Diplocarpon rosae]|nr:SET domain protein [Diplocarpon rosae]